MSIIMCVAYLLSFVEIYFIFYFIKDFIFNQILFICYYNPILYISMCSKHVFASLFYVNDHNTAFSRLVCSVPIFLSFGTNAPPGELNVISLL